MRSEAEIRAKLTDSIWSMVTSPPAVDGRHGIERALLWVLGDKRDPVEWSKVCQAHLDEANHRLHGRPTFWPGAGRPTGGFVAGIERPWTKDWPDSLDAVEVQRAWLRRQASNLAGCHG